jgi:hypothetical protein
LEVGVPSRMVEIVLKVLGMILVLEQVVFTRRVKELIPVNVLNC